MKLMEVKSRIFTTLFYAELVSAMNRSHAFQVIPKGTSGTSDFSRAQDFDESFKMDIYNNLFIF